MIDSPVAAALAAAAHRLGDAAAPVLSRIGGALGEQAHAAHRELAAGALAPAKRQRAEILADARAPLPAGMRAVHPSWIEAALAPLPARARAAVAAPTDDPVDVWLARWATAALPPMPRARSTPIERLIARDSAAILDWLASLGADQMAFALGAEGRSHPLLAAAAERISSPPRAGTLGSQRAAIGRCRGVSVDDPRGFVRVGARALAPHVAGDVVARLQLSRRLPRDLGLLVERELRENTNARLDQAPALPAT